MYRLKNCQNIKFDTCSQVATILFRVSYASNVLTGLNTRKYFSSIIFLQVTSVYTLKSELVYGEGEYIYIHVVYTHYMDVLGTPSIALSSGGEALFATGGRTQVQ